MDRHVPIPLADCFYSRASCWARICMKWVRSQGALDLHIQIIGYKGGNDGIEKCKKWCCITESTVPSSLPMRIFGHSMLLCSQSQSYEAAIKATRAEFYLLDRDASIKYCLSITCG